MASNHPLPPSPGQPQRPDQRQRAKSSFSFRSHHSQKSSGSGQKIDLHETHEEKDSKRIHSKADPSMALAEAEPCELRLLKRFCYTLWLFVELLLIKCYSCGRKQCKVIIGTYSSHPTSRFARKSHRFVLLFPRVQSSVLMLFP